MHWQVTKDLRHVNPIEGCEERDDSGSITSEVVWQRDKRDWVDKPWAFLFGAFYIIFVVGSISILSQAHLRYSFDDVFLSAGERVSDYYQQDVASCCNEVNGIVDNFEIHHSYSSLCIRNVTAEGRRLQDTAGKLNGDEGIFEAFEKRPDIIVCHIFATSVVAISWVTLVGKFSKSTIFTIEWSKAIFLCLFLAAQMTVLGFIGMIFALCFVRYLFKRRKNDLEHASLLINHGTTAFKESWQSLSGLVTIKIFYFAQVCIFIVVLIASLEVVDVAKLQRPVLLNNEDINRTDSTYGTEYNYSYVGYNNTEYDHRIIINELSCEFRPKPFVAPLVMVQTITFALTIMIFDQVRLCVVSMIIGSWRFHPESTPPTTHALKTALTKSLGSLSAAALLTTISESFRRRNRSVFCWFLFPCHCIMCFCGCLQRYTFPLRIIA
mmetsp:Transcript_163/g.360  ORF Transcript_163/g.360 Transcript_163/m.360 type:complete len:437 (-) Transcript_163:973-2283(-)